MNEKKLLNNCYAPLSFLFMLLFFAGSVWGQETTTVQGTVTDAFNQEPLPGVNISVVGGTKSTHTDANGAYRLQVQAGKTTLRFSYVGYEPQDLPVSGNQLSVALKPASNDLNEVVVVAYGTAKRSSFTGSVAAISQDKIANRQVSSVSKALQGQVPGLQSVSSSGQPGTDAEIRIRGIGSINASSAPLYVVDGNPYSGDINAINPNDIKSVSVLKDAAASALYGSRGANGVIIITTKEGLKDGKTTINFNFTQGISDRAVKDYEQVSTNQYFELYWEALRNKNLSNGLAAEQAAQNASNQLLTDLNINPYGSNYPQPVGLDGKIVPAATPLWNDNWADVLQRTGRRTQADLSFSGGNEKSSYYFSGGYLNDQGIAIESGFKRYNARINVNTQAKKWLNAGLNVAVSSSLQKYPQSEDSNTANIINFTRLVPSFYPYYERNADGSYRLDEDGNKIYDFGEYRPSAAIPRNNLAASLPLDKNEIRSENLSGRAFLEAVITPELKFRTTYSIDYINRNTHDYVNPVLGDGAEYQGSVAKSNRRRTSYTWNNIVTYEKTFNEHHLNVLAGQEFYKFQNTDMDGSRERFVLPGFYEPDAASQLNSFNGFSVDYSMLSFLGRVEYDYKNRYFLSGSLRTDGSSRFSPDNRWGTFWSVGASWKIAEEEFLRNNSLINQLTVRASYGAQGNDNLLSNGNPIYYAYQGLYSISNNLGQGGTVTQRLPTPTLKWESNLNFNAGLDIAILDQRVAASFEYFNRKSKDLLYTMPKAPSTGFPGYDANIGALQNTGFELTLQTVPVRNDNFRWNLDLNLGHYKNKITELPNGGKPIPNGNKLLAVGGSIYDFYLPTWAGVDPATGSPLWYKADANGNQTAETTSEYGQAGLFVQDNSLPDLVGGFSNTVSYKNFDLSALLSFSLGGKILDNDYIQLMHNGSSPGRAWSTEILNRWTPENTQTDVPRLTTDNLTWTSASTRFLYSATYARLKNVSLGYNFSKHLIERLGIANLRVFLQGENLLTFYGHKGMDPEQTVNGATYFRYPAMRTVSAGLQLTL
ncbi:SusC/RagA family TonB-linked outer membrane protein [Olivibacter jilunii]|uniref:SusC/RagA family TonB-linked outer membrane protein n=1 Tax=Olivibacter jilunii TaxID=985016 RepID=UPI003F17A9DD